jgi:hypothetical protein
MRGAMAWETGDGGRREEGDIWTTPSVRTHPITQRTIGTGVLALYRYMHFPQVSLSPGFGDK